MSANSTNKSPAKRKAPELDTSLDNPDIEAEPTPGCSTSFPSATVGTKGKQKKKKVSFSSGFEDSQPFFTDEEDSNNSSDDDNNSSSSSSSSSSDDTDIIISSDDDSEDGVHQQKKKKKKKKIDKVAVSSDGKLISRKFKSAASRNLKAVINLRNAKSYLTISKKTASGPKVAVVDEKAVKELIRVHDRFLKRAQKVQGKKKNKKSTSYVLSRNLKRTHEDVSLSLVKISGKWYVALSNWTRNKIIHIDLDDYLCVISFVQENKQE